MRQTFILLTVLFAGALSLVAQSTPADEVIVKAAVTNTAGVPIVGATLFIAIDNESSYGASTDADGIVSLRLKRGTNEIRAGRSTDPNYRLTLFIPEKGPIPNNVNIVLDPDKYCCRTKTGETPPKPLSLPRPPFPPAARAVGAWGEVIVEVEVNAEGKVVNAAAVSGHPLLRASSVAAARQATFEPGKDGTVFDLTYAFRMKSEQQETTKQAYENLYRIVIVGENLFVH